MPVEYIDQTNTPAVLPVKIKNPNNPVKDWQYNKIRILLQKIYGSAGYPTRFMEYIGYFSGVALWIPERWVVLPMLTERYWRENWDLFAWKTVWIGRLLPDNDEIAVAYPQFSDLSWDRVKEIAHGLVGGLSNAIDNLSGMDLAQIEMFIRTAKPHHIYPNLGFYNTINNLLIDANRDYIKSDLNSAGYLTDW